MWLKVDHHILDHQKWEILEDDPVRWCRAVAVWVACGTVCSRLQTDGLILASRVRRACPLDAADVQAALDDLVLAGFLVEQDGELWMHNFLKYNFSRDEQDAKKASKSARNKRNYEARRASAEKEIKPGLSAAEKGIKSRLKKDSAPLRTVPSTKNQDPSTKNQDQDTPAPIGTDTEEDSMWSDRLKKELRRTGRNQADLRQKLLAPPSRDTVRDWCSGKVRPSDDEQADIDRVMALFAKQHAAKLDAGKSEAQRYQDDVCLGFAAMWSEKFGATPMWKPGRDFAAIKRWREANVSTHAVLERADVMLGRSGSAWPCEHGCDFGTLIQHFDRFVEVKKPVEAPRPMTRAAKARKAAAEANR